ncbi:hypothetical protein FRB95_003031 [Tulasnella sp. JGI-2019a]|nr:hypothetical protein FRB95_003031 [Tulasnella sp. JGI-2019a]
MLADADLMCQLLQLMGTSTIVMTTGPLQVPSVVTTKPLNFDRNYQLAACRLVRPLDALVTNSGRFTSDPSNEAMPPNFLKLKNTSVLPSGQSMPISLISLPCLSTLGAIMGMLVINDGRGASGAYPARILIIGKANAGKTSILKKICGESVPIVLDRDGNPRGMHEIDYEIIYPSRPGFSFYDSRGIESGSTEELDKVADFITRRSIAPLEERLHATWVCLSLDDERPVGEAELRMLDVKNPGESKHSSPSTHRNAAHQHDIVPVVVVFTKYDGLETRALNTLRREGLLKPREAFRAMAATAERLFKEHWLNRIYTTEPPKPPFVRLKDLDKPQGKCDDLLECTADMLQENRPAQKTFVLAQSYSPEKRLKHAMEE